MSAQPVRPIPIDPVSRLQARVEELEAERRRHLAIIELLRDLSSALNYRDIVQTVARRMGLALGLTAARSFWPSARAAPPCIWWRATKT
ncbi:MAG: hypothetical protein R2909_23690 [Gemmatimonadales bacterium]